MASVDQSHSLNQHNLRTTQFMKQFILSHLDVRQDDVNTMDQNTIAEIYGELLGGIQNEKKLEKEKNQHPTTSKPTHTNSTQNNPINCYQNNSNLPQNKKNFADKNNQLQQTNPEEQESEDDQIYDNTFIDKLQRQGTHYRPRKALRDAVRENNRYRMAFVIPKPKGNEIDKILSILKSMLPRRQFNMIKNMHPQQIKNMYNDDIQKRKKQNWHQFYKAGKKNQVAKNFSIVMPKVNVPLDFQQKLLEIPHKNQTSLNQKQSNHEETFEKNKKSLINGRQKIRQEDQQDASSQKNKRNTILFSAVQQLYSSEDQVQEVTHKRSRNYYNNELDIKTIIQNLNSAPAKLFITDNLNPLRKIANPDLMAWISALRQRCEELEQNCPEFIQDFSSDQIPQTKK